MGSLSACAFLKFHLAVGIRVALRVQVAAVALFFALFYLLKPELFIGAAAWLISLGLPAGAAAALSFFVFAGIASRRICLGLPGWIRHLPASGSRHRRLAVLAVLSAQLPILLIWTALAIAAHHMSGVPVFPFLAGLPFSSAAAALALLPVRRPYLSLPLAASAAVLATASNWLFLGSAVLLIAAADLSAGPLAPARARLAVSLPKGMAFHLAIAWRALRLRLIIAYLPSLFLAGLSYFFLANNLTSPRLAATVVRLNGALSLILFCGVMANILASRRPPWPWIRSLPLAASSRILNDALLFGLHTAILLIPVALIEPRALWPLAAALPLLSLRAARAVPLSGDIRGGPLGILAKESALGALLIGLFPAAALLLLPALPLSFKEAANAERTHKVSRWLELHHLAAGDPLSWSRQ